MISIVLILSWIERPNSLYNLSDRQRHNVPFMLLSQYKYEIL